MAADIYDGRALTKDGPAWWDIDGAHVFTEPMTASEALAEIDGDFGITKVPVYAKVGDTYLEIPDRKALLRDETSSDFAQVLGIVGNDHGILQNSQITKTLDPLTDEWPVETIGCLGKGEDFFISLKVGTTHVGDPSLDEVIDEYFLVSEFRGKGRAARLAYTPERVVCRNTLQSGLSVATVNVALFHSRNIEREFKFRVDMMAQLRKARSLVLEKMSALTLARVVDEQVAAIINAAYPIPRPPRNGLSSETLVAQGITVEPDAAKRLDDALKRYEFEKQTAETYREFALGRYDIICQEFPKIAATAWGAWQAVTEVEDHRRGRSANAVAVSATFGDRARRKGLSFAAALAVAGISPN